MGTPDYGVDANGLLESVGGQLWPGQPGIRYVDGLSELRFADYDVCVDKQGSTASVATGKRSRNLMDGHRPRGRSRRAYAMLMARAASTAIVTSEMDDWAIIRTFARLDMANVSVGLKAVLVLNARNK